MIGPPASSRYQQLVDRWVDLIRWPTAKKVALVMSVALAFHVVVPAFALLAFMRAPGLLDVATLARCFAAYLAVIAVVLAVSLVVAWRGLEGRWTAYLLIVLYGICTAWTLWSIGTMSTPLSPVLLMIALGMLVFFDSSIGRAAFAWAFISLTVVSVLELTGRIPFAPLMLMRTLDSQRAVGWYVAMYVVMFSVSLYLFILMQLSVSARERQQQRLEAAHQALSQTSSELARANEIISRYVASQLVDTIRSGHYDEVQKHDRRKLTLFFSDIKDFTAIAERLEPEDLSAVLNEYLSEMSSIAQRHGGTIDKFVGDAIMILFGAPIAGADRDQAVRAVRMAIEMQDRLVALREKWHRDGVEHDVTVRIGINTGQVTVGNFGSPDRMDYTAIGRQVNLAARLQTHCEPGRILVSHSTYALIEDAIPCLPRGEMQVKGFEHPVRVYEVVPPSGS